MPGTPGPRERTVRRLELVHGRSLETNSVSNQPLPEIRSLGVERLALFGSVLRDEARPESDVDVLVGFAPGAKSFDRLLALSELLEERLDRSVEVVTTEALSPFLGPRILAEAQDVLSNVM